MWKSERFLKQWQIMSYLFTTVSSSDLNDIEDAGRNAGFSVDVGQHDRCQRSEWRWFEYDRVASGQRRRWLPHSHLQRIVPGTDSTDDTERLTTSVAPATIGQRHMITCDTHTHPTGGRIYRLRLIGLVRRSAAAWRCVLHSSDEPSELSQWQCAATMTAP